MSMRLPLPSCYTLVGVSDQDRWLREDEVYACVAEDGKAPVWITGRIAITRSPTLDAGDVRIVHAVGKLPEYENPRFKSLRNCVVLPSVEKRSLASQMGGGDLDGDRYQLITIESLIPDRQQEPGAHTSHPPRRLGRPSTIDDVAHAFVDWINNETVGVISITHLKLADSSPLHGADPRAKKLAELHSRAVDYVKTGNVVKLEDIPKVHGKRPDFLKNDDESAKDSDFYESQRALGVIYRAVPDPSIRFGEQDVLPDAKDDSSSPAFLELRRAVESKLSSRLDFQPLDIDDDHAPPIIDYFCATLLQIATVFNFPRRPGRHLSEAEAFLGTILCRSRRDNQGRKQAVSSLIEQTARLAGTVEAALYANLSPPDRLRMLWASWTCALESDERKFGIKSFRWMSAAMLLEAMAQYEQLESPPSPSRPPPIPPVVLPSRPPRRAPPPPLSHAPTTTQLPRKVPKAKKKADLASQARYYAAERWRIENSAPEPPRTGNDEATSQAGGIGDASQSRTVGSSSEESVTTRGGGASTSGWGSWGSIDGDVGSSSRRGLGGSGSGRGADKEVVVKDPWEGW